MVSVATRSPEKEKVILKCIPEYLEAIKFVLKDELRRACERMVAIFSTPTFPKAVESNRYLFSMLRKILSPEEFIAFELELKQIFDNAMEMKDAGKSAVKRKPRPWDSMPTERDSN